MALPLQRVVDPPGFAGRGSAAEGRGGSIDPELARVQSIARVLDRYMLDPILGLLLPGVGDVIGSMLGLYTVSLAVKRRVSPVVIARMLLNLAIDGAIGVIPLVGDLFDLGFKANEKNVALFADRQAQGGKASPRDWLILVGAVAAFIAVIGVAVFALVTVVRAIAHRL